MKGPSFLGTFEVHSHMIESGSRMAVGSDGTLHVAADGEPVVGTAYSVGSYCKHCEALERDHGPGGKCLFESTTFERSTRVQVEMRGGYVIKLEDR